MFYRTKTNKKVITMFGFMKKKEKGKKKVFVPDGSKRKLLSAWDDYMSAPSNKDKLLRYDFWELAGEVCPETLSVGNWRFVPNCGVTPYFEDIGKNIPPSFR